MDAGRSRVSIRRNVQASQRLRHSSTAPLWLKSRYPQPSLICSTLPADAPLWPRAAFRAAQCLIRIEAAVLDRLWATTSRPDV